MKALLLTFLLAGTFLSTTAFSAKRDILIGGGSVTGVYYQVALQACNIINKKQSNAYNCVGRPALGSNFNINAVNRGLLDFGVAQSDRNWQAWKGKGEWKDKPVKNLRSVLSMHAETVLLVTRKDTGIDSVKKLKGKVVNIGNPGSGHRGNALDVLKLYGLDHKKDIKAQGLQQQEASRALTDRKIDAFFYTVGNPSAAIEDPANTTDIKIVPLASPAVKKFVGDKPYYVNAKIPSGSYKGVANPVDTYGVKATVVTSSEVSDQVVYDFVKTLFSNLKDLKKGHAAFRALNSKEMLQGLSAPLHPGAKKFYKEKGWL